MINLSYGTVENFSLKGKSNKSKHVTASRVEYFMQELPLSTARCMEQEKCFKVEMNLTKRCFC